MKKTLLIAALGLVAATASADYKEYFELSFDGQPIENGATITINKPEYSNDKGDNYDIEIPVKVLKGDDETPTYFSATFNYNKPAQADCIGNPSFCNDANCFPPNSGIPGNIGYMDCNPDFGYYADEDFKYLIHLNEVPKDTAFDQTYELWMGAYTGEVVSAQGDMDFEQIPDTDFRMYVRILSKSDSVNGIEIDEAAAEYFNLEGVRIEKPESGIVIVKRGDKVSKEIIRK